MSADATFTPGYKFVSGWCGKSPTCKHWKKKRCEKCFKFSEYEEDHEPKD